MCNASCQICSYSFYLFDVCSGLCQSFAHKVALQAYRDNHRISIENPAFAEVLWTRTGLYQVCEKLQYKGLRAVGLNPNIRFYRYGLHSMSEHH
jgi:hypothetical protein